MDRKRPRDVIPSPYNRLFENYDSFNAIQTKLLNDLLDSDKSIVLSAPTGSGKTVAYELAIVRMYHQSDLMQSTSNYQQKSPKAIYIAPTKALCNEIFENWNNRFNLIGINVSQLTGDTQTTNLMMIRQSQIVISTPEKWDSLTRRWRDFEELLPSVQLCIIDEVHLLNEDTRGPILEVIVSRMKSSGVKRFIMASATIPNVHDLTKWLSNCNVTVSPYVFNDIQRPVPLIKHILGVKTNLKGFQFDMKLNYQLPEIIRKFSESKATLVFCNCRKSAEMAAFSLNKQNSIFDLTNYQKTYLDQLAQQLNEPKLRKLVEKGIAYHHAGLQYSDRKLIESSFRKGFLMILLSTSTLAIGINLPAHLVIIKSTETYMNGGYVEYPENMLIQMIGRAGRPQYDTKGVAVILTQHEKIEKYKKLTSGKAPIESYLHKHLTEHLNSEIALSSISNLEMAMDWIRSTYLYVRSVRNPKHYGFSTDISKDMIEHKLEELTFKQIVELQKANLVKINHVNGFHIQTTDIGKLMAKYYLCFETIKLFGTVQGNSSLKDIFELIVNCKELKEFTLRVNEKNILNSLNKDSIRFPFKGRIKSTEQKISCLMQAILGNIEIKSPGLLQESLKMFRIADRVSKCLLEFVRLCVQKLFYNQSENLWYKTILNTFISAKCIHVKLWENTEYASKQLHGIGNVYSSLLSNAGKTTLKSIAETEAYMIENILNKAPPFGDEVLKNLILFPEYEIKLSRKSTDFIQVYAKQLKRCYKQKPGSVGVVIVGDSFGNLLLLAENVDNTLLECGQFERTIRIKNPEKVEFIYAHIVHTCFVGVDVRDTLEINEPKIENSTKRGKKPNKQTQIKNKCNKTVNESDFLPEKSLCEEENKTDDIQITIPELKQFQCKEKPKLSHIKHDENQYQPVLDDDIDDSLSKIATIKPLSQTNYMEERKDFNTTNDSSNMLQRKLTDFFAQRKKSNFQLTQPKKNEELNRIPILHSKEELLKVQKITETNDQSTSNIHQNHYIDEIDKTIEFPNDPYENSNIHTNKSENSFPIKRKLISNDHFSNSIFYNPAKKQRQQNNQEFKQPRKHCPISLEPFHAISRNEEKTDNISTLLEKENFPIEIKEEQPMNIELFQKKEEHSNLHQNHYTDAIYTIKSNNSFPIKRKLISNDHFSNSIFYNPAKKQRQQNNQEFKEPRKHCPISLESFLATSKNEEKTDNISTLLEKENYPMGIKEEQPMNFELFQKKEKRPGDIIKLSPKKQNFESPLDRLNDVKEKKFKLIDEFNIKKSPKSNTSDRSLDNLNPSEEEFELWYKVALKFQRLPTQALSLKNFRYVFNKMFKEKQNKLTSTSSRPKDNGQVNSKKNIFSTDSSQSSSSTNSFRLKLFRNDEYPTNNTIQSSTIKLINESVMKLVMATKFAENEVIDNIDIDADLEIALSDLEKDKSLLFGSSIS